MQGSILCNKKKSDLSRNPSQVYENRAKIHIKLSVKLKNDYFYYILDYESKD